MKTNKYFKRSLVFWLLAAAIAVTAGTIDGPGSGRPLPGMTLEVNSGCFTGTDPGPGVKPPPESLSGSNVVFDAANGDDCWLPGTAHQFAFTAASFTNDWEYVYTLWLRFPSDWTVTNVQLVGTPVCTGGSSWGDLTWSLDGGSNIARIAHSRYQAYSDSCTATYLVSVTTGAAGLDAQVSWYWDGDGYNAAPHHPCSSDSFTPGSMSSEPCDQAINPPAAVPACSLSGVYLSTTPAAQSGCPGDSLVYPFTLMNFTGATATFDIAPSGNAWGVTQPATVGPVAAGGTANFNVTHTIPGAAADGATDSVTITATDQSNASTFASASFTSTADSDGEWFTVAASTPSWNGEGYPCRGCTAMNSLGQWNTYIIGDTSSYSGFWAYNHDTNTWSQPGPSGLPSNRWSPGWAYDPATNLCYMTGGATTAGGGNLTQTYVFDPVANSFTALPNFTSARDFHNSWVGSIDGTKYLCIGGGVNSGSTVLSSTQCYDIGGGTWQAENAQMGAYPFGGRWGAAEGYSGGRFWVATGADAGFALTGATHYFDDADNLWHNAGNVVNVVYRTNGAVSNGEFYVIGGSSGGFTPTDHVQHFTGSAWESLDPMPHTRMDLVCGTDGDGTIWVVDGYGAGGSNYVDYMTFCGGGVVCPTITLSPASMPDGVVGMAYSQTVTASGGTAPYTYTISSGTLPDGLVLDTATGTISGTPTAEGIFTFTIMATDSASCTGSATYTITTTFAFDWSFYDDYNRSQVCINHVTGYYSFNILAGPGAGIHYGKARVSATFWGYFVREFDKVSGITLYYYTFQHRANGSFISANNPKMVLLDSNVADSPACGGGGTVANPVD